MQTNFAFNKIVSSAVCEGPNFWLLLLLSLFFPFQMSESDTDESDSFSVKTCLSPESDQDSEVDSDCGVVVIGGTITTPYEDEPILHGENIEESEEEVDIDAILLLVLQSRFEKEISLNEWLVETCLCENLNMLMIALAES